MTAARVDDQLRGFAVTISTRLRQSIVDLKNARHRARIGRVLLYVLVALLPIHAGLVAAGVPALWKELILAMALLVALTLPARARFERVDYLVVVYFFLVALSAAVHRVTNLADLSPYFLYAPFAIVMPRLLVTTDDLAILVRIGIGSLLFNAAWMVALRIGAVDKPNLLLVDGPHWMTTGSLTGGALATATLYGVASGAAWIAAATSRRRLEFAVLGAAFTGACALTGSRAAIVASGVGLLVALVLLAARLRSKPVIGPLLIGVCICMMVGSVIAVPLTLRADDSLRASRWEAALRLAAYNPLLGAGPGATSQSRVMRELGLGPDVSPPDNLIGTRVSESSVLKVAAEIGLVGSLAFTAWVISVLIRTGITRPWDRRDYEFVGPAIVVLTLVNGLTYQNMESFIGATLFWMGIGLCRARLDAARAGAGDLAVMMRAATKT